MKMSRADKMFEDLGFRKLEDYDHPLIEYINFKKDLVVIFYKGLQKSEVILNERIGLYESILIKEARESKLKELGWIDEDE